MKDNGKRAPRIVGTGLVALDVVYRNRGTKPVQIATGGTCGNVLAILAYLGWGSVPLARLDKDPARRRIAAELTRWGVDTRFLSIAPLAATPIIVENLTTTDQGDVRHSFSWNCPCCGQWLPRYSPVVAKSVRELAEELPEAEVFFFDRPAPSALSAAEHYAERGALIVFEPSAQGKPASFARALELAHVVKYADNRMERLPVAAGKLPRLILEIQTRGHNGLRYRCMRPGMQPGMLPELKRQGWRTMRALRAPQVVDTVGCGDWCTAGLLTRIGAAGVSGLQSMRADDIRDALQYSQALAAWNCGFLGARGGMVERSAAQMKSDVNELLSGRTSILGEQQSAKKRTTTMSELCPACHTNGERLARRRA